MPIDGDTLTQRSVSLGLILLLTVCAVRLDAASNENSALGINLASVTYWSAEIVFVDLFKHSQTWKSQAPGKGYDQGGPLDLTEDGWLRSLRGDGHFADSIILSRPELGYPAGVYTCLYEGKGKILFAYRTKVVEETPGRIRVQVNSEQDLLSLRVTETDPANPIRNIRVILPGFEDTYEEQPFHPEFLKRWEKFKVLRFMDLQRTNNSEQTSWSDRPTTQWQTQGNEAGVALEYLIQLANTLDADPWFCMPHLATDDYIRSFAQMVKAGLEPGLKLYIEYSNECWNGMFAQARYCRDKGKELGLSTNDFQAQLRYYSKTQRRDLPHLGGGVRRDRPARPRPGRPERQSLDERAGDGLRGGLQARGRARHRPLLRRRPRQPRKTERDRSDDGRSGTR